MAERKGFKTLILATVQNEKQCSVKTILEKINDPALKEQYIKNILYRAAKEGQVRKSGSDYIWCGEVDESLNKQAEVLEEKAEIRRQEVKKEFSSVTEKLLYLCNGSYCKAPDVIRAQHINVLESFHEEQFGPIPKKARTHSQYLLLLPVRLSRKLEALVREANDDPTTSDIVLQRNEEWFTPDLMTLLDNPPESALGIPLSVIYSTTSVNTTGSGVKRVRKGFRGMILDCIASGPTTISEIMKKINDPALKEQYVKFIIYRMHRENNIEERGGKIIWTGPAR